MYSLPYFKEDDKDKVISFMKENSFAIITGFGDEFPVSSHIPLHISIDDGRVRLSGHLMKNTDHHKAFLKNDNVLVIFNGPHTYVSAAWYEKKDVASTWNYMAVHATGKIKFTDEEGTYEAVKAITNKYEGSGSEASFDKLSPAYIKKLITAIVGFNIEVTGLENVFKLSQNHTEETRQSIITNLQQSGDAHSIAIAKEMEKRLNHNSSI